MTQPESKVNILGMFFLPMTDKELKNRLSELLGEKKQSMIFTPNAEILYSAATSKKQKSVLESATLLLPDGTGVFLASRILKAPLYRRHTGIDSAEYLLFLAAEKGYSVFLLGGKEGYAREAAKNLCKKLPKLNVCGTHHGYFNKEKHSEENLAVCKKIKDASPDILFVCFGSPVQEKWIYENISDFPSLRLAMGLGGSIDVWSKNTKRAPRIMRVLGLEWLFRIISEPKRIKRTPSLIGFACLVLKQKLKKA